jgi:protoporphyrinogen oxidase
MLIPKIIIIGTGPAGIGCAYTLTKSKQRPLVITKDEIAGGLCRTINFSGYLFDIGGHRFISESEEINRLWRDIMNGDLLKVQRLSRIYYRRRYFNYPLSFLNTFRNLGFIETLLCIASYLWHKYFTSRDGVTFESWIIKHFGKRLFKIFFKSYTEKVWGILCQDISADWAKQRIRGLSLRVAIQKVFFGLNKNYPKTLCEEFFYPKTGPGELYRRLQVLSAVNGAQFLFGENVIRVKHNGFRIISVQTAGTNGEEEYAVDYLFSSIPLPIFVMSLDPVLPQRVIAEAKKLHFRSLIVVNIILDKKEVFPDQWLYVHSPEVKLGRIQNYKNWSPYTVIDRRKTTLGLEYFCNEGDSLWLANDVDLIQFAINELEKIGIASRKHLINAFVVRCAHAYPVYSLDYQKSVDIIRDYLSIFKNFQTMGRGGLFRYDNSDHALLTGIYAAKNFLGKSTFDLWAVNTEDGYLET